MDNNTINRIETDIDIDTQNRDNLLSLFKHVPASIIKNEKTKKHNTGVYFHKVPVNPFNGLCSVDYRQATDNGFFKLDILNVSIYKDILSEDHLNSLMETEPMWELLEHKEIVENLFHIHNHYDVVSKMKPKSVSQLAAVLALIRPAKRHLIGKDWDTINSEVWNIPEDNSNYYFKKSHSYAYALTIIVQLNLLAEQSIQN